MDLPDFWKKIKRNGFSHSFFPMLPNGLEPPLLASEASALSIKLRGQLFAKATELKSVYNNGDNFKSIEHSAKKFKGIAEKLQCVCKVSSIAKFNFNLQ